MAETSGGSHELLPHLDDGDEGGAAQRVLGILLILLTNYQLFFRLKSSSRKDDLCSKNW
jgi:hypothetical protein